MFICTCHKLTLVLLHISVIAFILHVGCCFFTAHTIFETLTKKPLEWTKLNFALMENEPPIQSYEEVQLYVTKFATLLS